jgi:hypothetical protein
MRAMRHVLALVAITAVPAAIAAGCVDGVTPDCSDPATPCGPDLSGVMDGSLDGTDGDAPFEAAADTAPDVQADADADADLDGGDGG